ncbi:MAG: hypothetical protein FJ271_12525 [Planctomycetes bacterium]|nr:hypothetical protein [Planctomycetota bacterium]
MVRIVLMSMGAAIAYGVLHDQVSARICVEYFTVAHPPIFGTDDPTLLGLGWGVFATWWVGLFLGVLLALAARAGERPKRDAAWLSRPLLWLMAFIATTALLSGLAGWAAASSGIVTLSESLSMDIPTHKHVPFLAVAWAHAASYLVGAAGGLVLIARAWRSRRARS